MLLINYLKHPQVMIYISLSLLSFYDASCTHVSLYIRGYVIVPKVVHTMHTYEHTMHTYEPYVSFP